jgi:heme/copper-type cytochrome/quinol oxidase subunit 4
MSEIDKRIGSIESALAEQHGATETALRRANSDLTWKVAVVGFVISVGLTAVVLLANGVIK